MGTTRRTEGAHLQLGQHREELLVAHAAEGGPIHDDAVVMEQVALSRDVLRRVQVVACHPAAAISRQI